LLQGGDVTKGHAPYAVSWGRLASTFVVALFALWLVRNIVKIRFGVDREFLSAGVRYGWKANLTSTLNYLNHRIDLLVLLALYAVPAGVVGSAAYDLKNTQVAFYSIAVTWAELVWHFPESMRDLFFSKVASSSDEEARRLTPVLCRLGLWISMAGAVAIVLLMNPIMGTITHMAKGSDEVWFRDWSPTVTASLWILVPGTVAYTVSKVLQADLGARDRLQTCVNAQLMVLVTMLGLDALLMPEHGALGAAAASSIAYAVATFYTLWAYGRQTGNSVLTCVLVRGSDFRYVKEIAGAILAKLRWRRK
jgi:O-antigen/teichoic acid export membrane protein